MACDTTHQHLAHRRAAEAARHGRHPHACICDCAVVAAVNRADRRRHLAAAAPDDRPTTTEQAG